MCLSVCCVLLMEKLKPSDNGVYRGAGVPLGVVLAPLGASSESRKASWGLQHGQGTGAKNPSTDSICGLRYVRGL